MNKHFKLIFLLIIFTIINFYNPAIADNYPTMERDKELITVSFPAGTLFRGILQNSISTAENKLGDPVELIMPMDIQFKDYVCFPKYTRIIGKVVRIERPAYGRNSLIQFVFEKLILPEGDLINITGRFSNKSNDGIIGGEMTDRIGQRLVPIYAEGIGNCKRVVKYGPRKMGAETEMQAGSEWTIILDKPVKIDVIDDEEN
ncbi:MAG: hypothetical protein WCK67_06755 [bacterium]